MKFKNLETKTTKENINKAYELFLESIGENDFTEKARKTISNVKEMKEIFNYSLIEGYDNYEIKYFIDYVFSNEIAYEGILKSIYAKGLNTTSNKEIINQITKDKGYKLYCLSYTGQSFDDSVFIWAKEDPSEKIKIIIQNMRASVKSSVATISFGLEDVINGLIKLYDCHYCFSSNENENAVQNISIYQAENSITEEWIKKNYYEIYDNDISRIIGIGTHIGNPEI